MARRSDHTREELRDLILAKAWDIAGKEGAEGLTARSLAKKIGYTPGTIYNVFESMDDLIMHLNARTLDMLYDFISKEVSSLRRETPRGQLQGIARAYQEFSEQYRPYWLLLFSRLSSSEGRQGIGWYQAKIDKLFTIIEDILTPLLQKRTAKKALAARTLWSSIHGVCVLSETQKMSVVSGKESPEDMLIYLVDVFIEGLENKS